MTPKLSDALPVWIRIGLLSFGGPAGQIALMQDEVVTRRKWVPVESFDRGLAFSMMLPGPEAQQLATWLGWRLHGLVGGLIAGAAFVVPGMMLMLLLAWVAAAHGQVPLVAALFAAVQPVVIALVLAAMRKIAVRALGGPVHVILAIGAFLGIWWLGVPFPFVIAAAALAGLVIPSADAGKVPPPGAPVLRYAAVTIFAAIAAIALCFLLTRSLAGPEPFDEVAVLFVTAALVTFGGAYAVLPFVAGQAVEVYAWLSPEAMLNGLAIAEATPGPLILVNTYAGFFAGFSQAGTGMGITTGLLATFYTFAPSFALILAFAPAVERLYQIPMARRALTGISAAVVGVIANLVLFLAEASFFPEGIAAPDWAKLALFALALPLVFSGRVGMLALIGAGLLAGLALYVLGLA